MPAGSRRVRGAAARSRIHPAVTYCQMVRVVCPLYWSCFSWSHVYQCQCTQSHQNRYKVRYWTRCRHWCRATEVQWYLVLQGEETGRGQNSHRQESKIQRTNKVQKISKSKFQVPQRLGCPAHIGTDFLSYHIPQCKVWLQQPGKKICVGYRYWDLSDGKFR